MRLLVTFRPDHVSVGYEPKQTKRPTVPTAGAKSPCASYGAD